MLIGLSTGGVYAYRVKTEAEYKEYEEFSYLNPHIGPVVGICIDYANSDVFSCGNDKRLVKSNLVQEIVLQDYVLDSCPLAFAGDILRQKHFWLPSCSDILRQ